MAAQGTGTRERRFRHRASDVLVRAPSLSLETDGDSGTLVTSRCGRHRTSVPRPLVEALLEETTGDLTAADVRWRVARTRRFTFEQIHDLPGVIDELIPSGILVPAAIEALEQRIRGYTIGRLPSSPYQIVREYWSNSADARDLIEDEIDAAVASEESFVPFLRRAHAVSILGASGSSYYQPTSGIDDEVVSPGRLRSLDPHPRPAPHGALRDGPPVAMSFGAPPTRYARVLAAVYGDPVAANGECVQHADGLAWGRGMFLEDDEAWYEPPWDVEPAHLHALWKRLAAALSGADPLGELAGFCRRFSQLHPFFCANQSLALNLANHVLERTVGRQIPHLALDVLGALLGPASFDTAFRRAVRVHGIDRDTPSPYAAFDRGLTAQLGLLERLVAAGTGEARQALIEGERDVAALMLLV